MDLNPGQAKTVTQGRDEPVQMLQARIVDVVEQAVLQSQQLRKGFRLFGQELLNENEQQLLAEQIGRTQEFLESLQVYKSASRLKNFHHDAEAVTSHGAGLEAIGTVRALSDLLMELRPLGGYLSTAETVLPGDHPWVAAMKQTRGELQADLQVSRNRTSKKFRESAIQTLNELQREYVKAYTDYHSRARLGKREDGPRNRVNQRFSGANSE